MASHQKPFRDFSAIFRDFSWLYVSTSLHQIFGGKMSHSLHLFFFFQIFLHRCRGPILYPCQVCNRHGAVIRLSPYSQSHGLAGHCPRQLISELQVSLAPPTLFSSRDRSIKPTARGA